MVRCLVGLGSNLSDRAAQLDAAVESLQRAPQIAVVAHSRWRETTPVGGPPDQPAFMNGALALETDLSAEGLLDVLQSIERAAGREHHERWGPRTLDLDLLLYGEAVIDTPRLTVPHPRMSFRRFVLDPACDVAPDMRHPVCDLSIAELRAALDRRPRWIAVSCPDSVLGKALSRAVAEHTDDVLVLPDQLGAVAWWKNLAEQPSTRPALIVLVSGAVPTRATGGSKPDDPLAMFRGLGPLLRLAPGPLDEMTAEVTAAIAALD